MHERPRAVFFGTPNFAVPALKALAAKADVKVVVTQPDRCSGRGQKICFSPVKTSALELGIEVLQPEITKGQKFTARIAEYKPDFIVTAAFGKLLGKSLLELPQKACLNVHASILPRHRGAAPANWTILAGDSRAGVSIMSMGLELDAGPVYLTKEIDVGSEETAGQLLDRLSLLGAEALIETLDSFDELTPAPQDETKVTWAPMLKKTDGLLDWRRPSMELHRYVRGMHPWPCAYTLLCGEPVKIHAAYSVAESGKLGSPGVVVRASREGLEVACGEGSLRIVEIQAPGRKRMHVCDFLKGCEICLGTEMGQRP